MLTRYLWEALETVIDAKYCILVASLVYCAAVAIGWRYAGFFSWLQTPIVEFTAQFSDLEALGFIIKIFSNNAVAVYITMCLVSIFGLLPLLSATLNGVVVGWVIAQASVSLNIGDVNPLALVPHGIFEWPAMMMGWGVGIWKGLGYRWAPIREGYGARFKRVNKSFFVLVIPLLIAAAIVEGRSLF